MSRKQIALRMVLSVALYVYNAEAQRPVSRSDVQGEWRGGELGGFFQKPDGCAGFQWMERTVKLVPVPGQPQEFRGVWVLHLVAIWTAPSAPARLKCRWGSETEFRQSSEAVSRQSLTAHLDEHLPKLSVASRLIDCRGTACAQIVPEQTQLAALSDKPEDARTFTLSFSGERLIDQDTPQHTVVLRRTGELAEVLMGAGPTRDLAWQRVDGSEFDAFEKMVAANGHPTLDEVTNLHASTGRILQRATNTSLVTTRPAQQSGADGQDSILFVSQVASDDGRQGTEIFVLVREGDQWKISLLYIS
jgi:hypothetical protein